LGEKSELYPLITLRGRSICLVLKHDFNSLDFASTGIILRKNPHFSKDLPFVFRQKNAGNPAENKKHKVSQSSANFLKVKSGLFAVQSRVLTGIVKNHRILHIV
jgi:hypothetical protein